MDIPRIANPLKYAGSKEKLMDSLLPLFPANIECFVDLFGGGANVTVNVQAKKFIYNDLCKELVECIKLQREMDYNKYITQVMQIIQDNDLTINCSKQRNSSLNYDAFYKLRDKYNENPDPITFFVLVVYSFCSFIKFGKKDNKFNVSAGSGDFNDNVLKRLHNFCFALKSRDIVFESKPYNEVVIPDNAFVYCDPPYLITKANYNSGWNEKAEEDFLNYLSDLNAKNIKFALSNVITHKGLKNNLLIDFMKDYNVYYLNKNYNSLPANKKNKEITQEVLITNYNSGLTDW